MYNVSVDDNIIDNSNFINIHKYLMTKHEFIEYSGFIGLLTSLVNASNNKKCVSSNNQQFTTQPTLINLHPNEYSQRLDYYYPFSVDLDKCVGNCNTANDLSNREFLPKKTKDFSMYVLNIITEIK